jgi:cyclopropane fatty-acyl-phospholipid synthase-like methyltransferase
MDDSIARRFPRSQKYSLDWITKGGMGSNPLWMTEWLCERLDLKPGMRVLDLGCGYARSSVFLAREFGVQVWAVDLWVPATENAGRIREEKLEDQIYPLHCDAKSLPFAAEFFDVIVAIDCYSYYGTDDLYLNYLVNFLKPGGQLGMAGVGVTQEMTTPIPTHLAKFWSQDLWGVHTADWWRRHWERTGLVQVDTADAMKDGWKLWSAWQRHVAPFNTDEIEAIEKDAGEFIGYIRLAARRNADVQLAEYVWPDTLKAMLQGVRHFTEQPKET